MKIKNNHALKIIAVAIVPVLFLACSQDNGQSENELRGSVSSLAFTDSVAFISNGDTVATIAVAIADEPDERHQGLMYINEMGKDEGMLFIFQKEQPLEFYMANTPLSLDIIFVNSQKEIIRIHRSTPPFTHEHFKSGEPALYAIEVNSGFTVSHDIREGIEVRF